MKILEVRDLVVRYGEHTVLNSINLEISPAEVVVVLGRNGVGKSTFLRSLFNLIPLANGVIRLGGQVTAGVTPRDLIRRGLVYLPQGGLVFPDLTVLDNLKVGLSPIHRSQRADLLRLASAEVESIGISLQQNAGTLSGGERQRLAIIRCLMLEPRVLLLDEPSLGLAPDVAESFFQQLRAFVAERGITIIIVEQRVTVVDVADRICVIAGGRLRFVDAQQALLAI